MDGRQNPAGNGPTSNRPAAADPARSRWTPKPEQILILESIFNSGMVNPPKEETARIRTVLQNFGSVGDANVFYWFQNRRSRSRRRQRQIQANLAAGSAATGARTTALSEETAAAVAAAGSCSSSSTYTTSSSSSSFGGCGSGFGYASSPSAIVGDYKADDMFTISKQMEGSGEDCYGAGQLVGPYDAAQMHYQTGNITVFINGIYIEVPRGAVNIRAMFGDDVLLFHSSGELLPVDDYGILLQSLQMGESYYLVGGPS
ncbi:WUSCHEL-related homeobox 6 [Platanthera guangdongensis]|uniref:WUSCHEL-related homeobox 6 n=1 Tax=Platanthera guangdongensis TaxID=2320717 RepID=A0ABR2MJL1_9ASPA